MIFPVGLLVHGLGLEGLGLGIQILELAGFVGTAAYGPWFLFGLEQYSKNRNFQIMVTELEIVKNFP